MGKFLQENLKDEKDRVSLQNIITEKALLKNDAINLLITILQAITINGDAGEDTANEVRALNDTVIDIENEAENDNDSDAGEGSTKRTPIKAKSDTPERKIKKSSCRFFKRGTCKFDTKCKFEHLKEVEIPKQTGKENEKTKAICKFYKNGKCKFSLNCKFAHPVLCRIYKQNGLKKSNTKGCDEDCKFFHPNGCRDSLKTKTCSRKDCRFFHINGTKIVEPKWQPNTNQTQCSSHGGGETKNRFEVLQSQCQQNCNPAQSQLHSHPNQNCGISTQPQSPKQVFQQEQSKTDLKIEALAK